MSLSRADLVADACILGGALVLAASVVFRPKKTGYRRSVHRAMRRAMLHGAVIILSMSDAVQMLIDAVTHVPNLGMLVRLVLLPVCCYRGLALQHELIGASRRRRRFHFVFTRAAVALTIVFWQLGASHTHILNTIPVAVPLGGQNAWMYALAWLFCVEVIVQCGSTVMTAYRITLHAYASGYDRTTIVSSILFGLAQASFTAVGIGLLLYPPGQATNHWRWIDFSTLTTEVFGVSGAVLSLAAFASPIWADRLLGRRRHSRLDTLLRHLLLLSSYGRIRRLALHLQEIIPVQRVAIDPADTRVWRVRGLTDLEILLQLFKTVINDARVALTPYVGVAVHDPTDPTEDAGALVSAIRNYRRRQRPLADADSHNPLRDASLWNDERFLAAIWPAYKDRQEQSLE